MDALKALDLYFNRFSGTIATEIGQLKSMQELVLNSNWLTGAIPTQIGQMSLLVLSLFPTGLSPRRLVH